SAITTKLIGNDPEKRPMYEGMIYDPRTRKVADDGTVYRDPLPNNRVPPELMDQVALRIQALIPKPSGPTPDGLSDNYLNPYRTSRVTGIPSIKIDHSFGPKGKLSFFWQRTKTE